MARTVGRESGCMVLWYCLYCLYGACSILSGTTNTGQSQYFYRAPSRVPNGVLRVSYITTLTLTEGYSWSITYLLRTETEYSIICPVCMRIFACKRSDRLSSPALCTGGSSLRRSLSPTKYILSSTTSYSPEYT